MSWSNNFKHRAREHRVVLAIIVVAGVLTVTIWSRLQVDGGRERQSAPSLGASDYTLKDFTLTLINERGDIDLRLSAISMRHLPATQRAEFLEPRVVFYERGQPRWHGQAETGWSTDDRRRIELQGQVKLERAARGPAGPLTLETQSLHVFPTREKVTSDVQVNVSQPNAAIEGIGMVLDL